MEASSPFEILVFSDSRNSKDYGKIKHKVNTGTVDGEGTHTGEILSVLKTNQNKTKSHQSGVIDGGGRLPLGPCVSDKRLSFKTERRTWNLRG